MNRFVAFTICAFLLANIRVLSGSVVPELTVHKCIPVGIKPDSYTIEFNKLEFVNHFDKNSLKNLLHQKDFLPEDNVVYNQFIYCVWKNENLMYGNDDVNYGKIENLIKQAMLSVVGRSGPAINLSQVHAKKIADACKSITGLTSGNKIMKIQNYIFGHLQPFAKI